MLTPLKEEIDISKWAANQPKVFIPFLLERYDGLVLDGG